MLFVDLAKAGDD
jgi:hypothetical protein